MLKHNDVWERIYKEDILYKNNGDLITHFPKLKKFLKYAIYSQENGSYFYHDSSMIYNTFYFCGILHCINKKPSEKTEKYIQSLQVGDMGFAETTGENPWTDKSYLAIQMFYWFNIPIQRKSELIAFFQNFQNADGGYGSLSNESSNFSNTVQTILILNELGSKSRNIKLVIQWLKENSHLTNPNILFEYIQSLILLKYGFNKKEKDTLNQSIFHFLNSPGLNYENKYYCVKSLILLRESIPDYDHIVKNKNILNNGARENYYLSELLFIYGKIEDSKDMFYSYTKKNELKQGGYSSPEISVIKNGFMVHSLYLINSLESINKDEFADWLLSISNHDGWGPTQNSKQYHEYTLTSLIALKLCGKNHIKNKEGIIRTTKEELDNALNFQHRNNYHVLRTIKNSLEKSMILNQNPQEFLKISNKVMEYSNEDGGFGPQDKSYLYATFWAIRSLYLCESYMRHSNKLFISKLNKIKEKTSRWIGSCQNEDGGFGPMPNQPSNIQSTFCAHYSLWMLDKKPISQKKCLEWLLSLQRNDGGFAGSKETGSEMLHILYVIGSLAILRNCHSQDFLN
ncbi:hypothetical protein ISS07_06865 [Candidatus Woesearchaeota archaeon]|nr:hypothetical protein [Candidatus Woesearchaeota archaeon]